MSKEVYFDFSVCGACISFCPCVPKLTAHQRQGPDSTWSRGLRQFTFFTRSHVMRHLKQRFFTRLASDKGTRRKRLINLPVEAAVMFRLLMDVLVAAFVCKQGAVCDATRTSAVLLCSLTDRVFVQVTARCVCFKIVGWSGRVAHFRHVCFCWATSKIFHRICCYAWFLSAHQIPPAFRPKAKQEFYKYAIL
jgi:hypothetical protein